MKAYEVRLIKIDTREVIMTLAATTEIKAQKIILGVSKDLDHGRYFIDYWTVNTERSE